jgi:hypothetical protein
MHCERREKTSDGPSRPGWHLTTELSRPSEACKTCGNFDRKSHSTTKRLHWAGGEHIKGQRRSTKPPPVLVALRRTCARLWRGGRGRRWRHAVRRRRDGQRISSVRSCEVSAWPTSKCSSAAAGRPAGFSFDHFQLTSISFFPLRRQRRRISTGLCVTLTCSTTCAS